MTEAEALAPEIRAAVEAFFARAPLGVAAFDRVRALLEPVGGVTARVTKSQVAFRRRRGLAYLWRPSQYLGERGVDVVLAIALPREVASPRWKQVVKPAPRTWMHHLEVRSIEDLDEAVAGWLREAAEAAG